MINENTKRLVFASNPERVAKITGWLGDRFASQPYCVVCISEAKKPKNFAFDRQLKFSRALILFEGLPINLGVVTLWREWAIAKGALELFTVILEHPIDEQSFKDVVEKHCSQWSDPPPNREQPVITRGQFVEIPGDEKKKDDPALLTMMFGSMGELLTAVDVVGRRFSEACNLNSATRDIAIRNYLEKIDSLLEGKNPGTKAVALDIPKRMDLPRLLLHGETGVGKTLIASYLHQRSGFTGRPLRIPIPEYLGKEDMFEYDLFGYMRGAYTDAKEADHGLLLANTGGVIFLDEIGEANSILQAKLLAYLDDYRVRPRKWKGEPFYCPTLIVAATNRDLNKMAEAGEFREDLLARFTDQHIIPPLRDRLEDLNFILDCLLQSEGINPEPRISEIGCEAKTAIVSRIKSHKLKGNFRELETIMRAVCQAAAKDGRNFICDQDVRRVTSLR